LSGYAHEENAFFRPWGAGGSGCAGFRIAERHPCFLFDPAVSLDLGASFDAKQISCQLADASSNLISVETFREALVRGFGAYNTGKCDKRSDDYAENVLRTAPSFWPGERRTP